MHVQIEKKEGKAKHSSRQRMLDAFEFNNPDKIPLVYHPSPAGLHVHGQKLLDLFQKYPSDNPIVFDTIPHPTSKAYDKDGSYHELIKDEWGTVWEYRIFGIQGHPKEYPFKSWKEGLAHPLPPIPQRGTAEYDKEKAEVQRDKKDFLVFKGWVSIFEKLHALRPMDEMLMDLATRENDIVPFLERLTEFWTNYISYYLEIGADVIVFGDDWGSQKGQFVSLKLFRDLFKPLYQQMMEPVKKAGKKVFFHACGKLDHIFDELLDLGIDGYWPQIPLYDEIPFAHKCKEHQVAIYIHPDRQRLIPLGTPKEIDDKIHEYADRYHELGGGGIFYVEMENDAPFENVKALFEAIQKYR